MRRYMQGTLDFSCGIYAVINALSCLFSLGLPEARRLFLETTLEFARHPRIWSGYIRNDTDHYFVVRYMLTRWCSCSPYELTAWQPMGEGLEPHVDALDLNRADLVLPEAHPEFGPPTPEAVRSEALLAWDCLAEWFSMETHPSRPSRTVILRFHRFLPGIALPVVSHWTCAKGVRKGAIQLHDASSEHGALHSLERDALLGSSYGRPTLRIVPESVVLLEIV